MNKERSIEKLREDLERLAKGATQGQWWIDSHGHSMVAFSDDKNMETVFITDPNMGPAVRHASTGNLSQWNNDVDATYIAAACPENILRLLTRVEELEGICGEAYQVVGALADKAGVFETSAGVGKMLDNLSQARMVHTDVLPFSVEDK
ncbi:hypothetical protein I4U30_23155 [Enterobacter asburiae]|nr:hypothetical protein [Enterobacter asburiae]